MTQKIKVLMLEKDESRPLQRRAVIHRKPQN